MRHPADPRRRAFAARRVALALALMTLVSARVAGAQADRIRDAVAADYGDLEALYEHFHAHPELSLQEAETSARLAAELRGLGFDVTERVGGHGVVAVLHNGEGPTVMVRTDMDALPIEERTGAVYASTVTAVDRSGGTVPVMHACGHDMHMSVLLGTARVMKALAQQWRGTLVLIGQPAEELLAGAEAMIEDGLFTAFPRPAYVLALHVNSAMASGEVGYTPGYAYANVDEAQIVVRGRGGHGAYPDLTVDPTVLAAKLVLDLQTVVSREISALDPAVITVGSIHGGTSGNIIPDEVRLELTLRSFDEATRRKLIEKIENRCAGVGRSVGLAPGDGPALTLGKNLPSLYNDPELAARVGDVFREVLGPDRVSVIPPVLYGEDFARYGRVEPRPQILMYSLGSQNPAEMAAADRGAQDLPSTHNSSFLPDTEPTLKTGVLTMSSALLELLSSTR